LTSIERKYRIKDVSHLELMQLQNLRTLQQSQLEIHTNDLVLVDLELRALTWGLFQKKTSNLDLPRTVRLSSETIEALVHAAMEAPWIIAAGGAPVSGSAEKGLGTQGIEGVIGEGVEASGGIRDAYKTWFEINIRRLAQLINSAANRYAAFSDEIQLRNQEGVATAIAALEQGRADLTAVVSQRRKLLGDHMEMLRLLLIQHEAVAELVYLGGLTSLEEAFETRR